MKYLLIAIICIIQIPSIAQDQYHITGMMVITKDKDGDYLYHKDWKEITTMAIVDPAQRKISILANSPFSFDITSAERPYHDKEDNLILKFICTDNKGKMCWISLITLALPIDNYQNFIKISYNDLDLLYRYIE